MRSVKNLNAESFHLDSGHGNDGFEISKALKIEMKARTIAMTFDNAACYYDRVLAFCLQSHKVNK